MKPTSLHMPLLCLGLVALAGCGKSEAPPQQAPADVTTVTLHPTDAPVIQHLQGRLSAYRTADVRARIAGVLLRRTYKEGTDVKQGQLLYQIDPAPYRATLNTDLGQLAQAKASYFNYHSIANRYRQLIDQHRGNLRTSAGCHHPGSAVAEGRAGTIVSQVRALAA